jgi:hypothetical protein
MDTNGIKHACMAVLIGMFVTGCGSDKAPDATGGGGGAGGGGGGGGGGGTTQSGQGTFVYQGSTAPAELGSAQDAKALVDAYLTQPTTLNPGDLGDFSIASAAVVSAAVKSPSAQALVKQAFRNVSTSGFLRQAAGEPSVVQGSCGGSQTTTTTITEGDIKTTVIETVWNQFCQEIFEGVKDVINGKQTTTYNASAAGLESSESRIVDLRFTSTDDTGSVTSISNGVSNAVITRDDDPTIDIDSIEITTNLDWQGDDNRLFCRILNGKLTIAFGTESNTIGVSGRFYFSPEGYVDVTGSGDETQLELELVDGSGGKATLIDVENGEDTIAYDLDGNGVAESSDKLFLELETMTVLPASIDLPAPAGTCSIGNPTYSFRELDIQSTSTDLDLNETQTFINMGTFNGLQSSGIAFFDDLNGDGEGGFDEERGDGNFGTDENGHISILVGFNVPCLTGPGRIEIRNFDSVTWVPFDFE